MDSAAHFHVQQQANGKKIRDEGGPSITQKRQRDAGDGEDSYGHADIKNNIKGNGNDKTKGKEKPKTISGAKGDVQSF